MNVQFSPNTKAVPPMMVRVRYPRLAVWPFQNDQKGANGESKQLTFIFQRKSVVARHVDESAVLGT